MNVIFCYQDIWDLVKNGVRSIGEDATDDQKTAHKDLKQKYYKDLFMIHQCIDSYNFEKAGDVKSTKEAWDILEKLFAGAEKVKEVSYKVIKEHMNCFRWKKVKASLIPSLG